MKIRTDFVTNSSSSSFTIVNIDNDILDNLYYRYGIRSSGKYQSISGNDMAALSSSGSISDFVLELNLHKDDWDWSFGENDFGRDFNAGLQFIREHSDEINAATKSATLEHGLCISDGDGSYWQYKTFKKGTISYYELDEYAWENEIGTSKHNTMLWQLLEGCESVADELKPFVEECGNVVVSNDPFYTEKKIDSIFDSFSSFAGRVVCLTGDFKFGSKQDVENYIKGKGGIVVSSVTKACNMVFVGALGSKAWSHNNYGTKVEKAIKLKESGQNMSIIKEEDVF